MEKFSPAWFEAKRLAREALDRGETPTKQPEEKPKRKLIRNKK